MDHSIRGYLERQSLDNLEAIIQFCAGQEDTYYKDILRMAVEIAESKKTTPD